MDTQPADSQAEIDHVSVSGSNLDALTQRWAELGFSPTYGGPHGGDREDGLTEMSAVGFRDGTYIELMAMMNAAETPPIWTQHLRSAGSPCGWSVRRTDLEDEAARIADLGIPVEGPKRYTRIRPDGTELEWKNVFLGNHDPGSKLPFLVDSQNPRTEVVPPDATESGLEGITEVVLGVRDLDDATALFRCVFELGDPETVTDDAFGAQLLRFPDFPATLASPTTRDGWLAKRLERFGESPCGYLMRVDAQTVPDRFHVRPPEPFLGRDVSWFRDIEPVRGRIGLVSR